MAHKPVQKIFSSFVRLCALLRDPLWFIDLSLTTKGHKGSHQGSQRAFKTTSFLILKQPSQNPAEVNDLFFRD
jgi:hypothetical protein